jgi:hypothetical protein
VLNQIPYWVARIDEVQLWKIALGDCYPAMDSGKKLMQNQLAADA